MVPCNTEMDSRSARSEALVQEIMNIFQMEESDATAIALSMLIRQLVLAERLVEAVA